MQTINLKQYYPFCTEDTFVEVSDEIVETFLLNKQRDAERRARIRRLIERGAIIEGVFSLAPDLSGEKVKAFLVSLSHLPGAAEPAAKLPKSGDEP